METSPASCVLGRVLPARPMRDGPSELRPRPVPPVAHHRPAATTGVDDRFGRVIRGASAYREVHCRHVGNERRGSLEDPEYADVAGLGLATHSVRVAAAWPADPVSSRPGSAAAGDGAD